MHVEAPLSAPVWRDNSWSSHVKATLALGIPLIGAQLAQLGIHTTDVVIVGRLGAESLAAMVLAGQFLFTLFIFGSGFSFAVMPMVAQAFGRGDAVSIRRSMRMGIWVAIGYWLLAMPVYLSAEHILLFLGQKPGIAALAGDYVAIAQIGMLPGLLFQVLRSLVSATNRASIILWVTIGMLVMNAVLAYALVLGHFGLPALGMTGAAIVSVLVQTAGLLFLIAYIEMVPETARYQLFVRFWRPDWHALMEVLHLGLPISITVLAEVSLFTVASLLMGWIGTMQLAAHGIALQLASVAFMIPLGLSQAATVRIGIAHSRHDYVGLVRAAISVMAIAAFIAFIGGILFALLPNYFASFFLDMSRADAREVMIHAGPFIVVAGIFQLVDGIQAVASGLLRGLKDARVPMVLALIAYWPIGFVLAYVLAFPLGFAGLGIWIGFLIGLAAAAVFLGWRFYALVRREFRQGALAVTPPA